jgi:hypothetical protein
MKNIEEIREDSEWATTLLGHKRVEFTEETIYGQRLSNLLYGSNRDIGSNKDYLEYFNSQNRE